MDCPKCGEQMVIAYKDDDEVVLWKCKNLDCRHVTLVQEINNEASRWLKKLKNK